MNQPHTHEQLTKEFKDLIFGDSGIKVLNSASIAGQCADIVIRERMKVLTLKSHSDQSTGEWRNTNPHDPAQKGIE